MRDWRTGERCVAECEGRERPARVVLASKNGRSLAVAFDGILAGHEVGVALLRDEAGVYRALGTGKVFTLREMDG